VKYNVRNGAEAVDSSTGSRKSIYMQKIETNGEDCDNSIYMPEREQVMYDSSSPNPQDEF
jgi:hypothetical protein